MMFHGDYEEALDNRESRNSPCPYDIRVGDLVRPMARWIGFDTIGVYKNSVGIITDVYKMTLEQSGQSYWCCKVFMDGILQVGPVVDFELVKRGNKD
jgi:hypothetical protein